MRWWQMDLSPSQGSPGDNRREGWDGKRRLQFAGRALRPRPCRPRPKDTPPRPRPETPPLQVPQGAQRGPRPQLSGGGELHAVRRC